MSKFSAKTTEPTQLTKPSIPLFIAGVGGQAAALYGLCSHFFGLGFALVLILLVLLGAVISYQWRLRPSSAQALMPGAIFLGCFFVFVQLFGGRFGRALPLEISLTGNDLALFLALSLTAVAASFFWLNDVAVLFSCVWSIAMMGVAATTNISMMVIGCFGVYLFCALFLMLHQSTLRQLGTQSPVSVTEGPLLWLQLRTALVLWLTTLVLGVLIAVPLQMIGRNMSLSQILDRLKVNPKPNASRPRQLRLLFDRANEFYVGLGPVQDDDTLIYRVHARRTFYWRLRTFAECQGNQWLPFGDDLQAPEQEPVGTRGNLNIFRFSPGLEGERKKVERVSVEVQSVANVRGICHLAEPKELRIAASRVIRRIDGTVNLAVGTLDLGSVAGNYELEAEVSTASAAELNKASRDYPPEILRRYLQEPQPGLLDKLALEALGSAKAPYDQAEAIRKFVANRCSYTLEAQAVPPGRNPAEWFLNDSRAGYCDLYATAVTLLCRAAGIPARVATGFNAGEIDPEAKDFYNLRERNRHAWCEVYFTGYGWIPFDATVITSDATLAPAAIPPSKQKKRSAVSPGPIVLGALGVLGLVGVGAGELLRRRQPRTLASRTLARERTLRQFAQLHRSALQQLKRHGVPRGRSMTTGEHVAAIQRGLGATVAEAYRELALICDQALFQARELGEADLQRAQQARSSLSAALRGKK